MNVPLYDAIGLNIYREVREARLMTLPLPIPCALRRTAAGVANFLGSDPSPSEMKCCI